MLLISFWQVLMFLIAFWSLKQAKNEGELGIIHGKSRLKLNYMKNPSFGELQSLCQINQVCKEENQRKNLTLKNFATHLRNSRKIEENFAAIFHHLRNFNISFSSLAKFSHLLFLLRNFCSSISQLRNLQIFCTDSVTFLSQDILCNYLFSSCNQLKILLDI